MQSSRLRFQAPLLGWIISIQSVMRQCNALGIRVVGFSGEVRPGIGLLEMPE